MMNDTIPTTPFIASIQELVREAFHGPPAGQPSWYADFHPGAGLIATLATIDAAMASRVPPGCRNTIAGHVFHLCYWLDVTVRALHGEDSFSTAGPDKSWTTQTVDEVAWGRLREQLAGLGQQTNNALARPQNWNDPAIRTGSMGLPAHLAYHLGAIRHLALVLRATVP